MTERLVVAGGGFSGLVTALAAQEGGMATVLCEASDRLGGAANYSRGTIWTMDEALLPGNPGGRRELQELVVRETAAGRDWLREQGIEFFERVDVVYGAGERLDIPSAIRLLASRFTELGGTIRLGARVVVADHVEGSVIARLEGGEELRADHLVLATGGFASSEELCRGYGVPWDEVRVRSHAFARGDGLRMALAAGGSHTDDDMHAFYGHAMAVTSRSPAPEEWFSVSQIYGHLVTAISYDGRRVSPPAGREAFFSDDEINEVIGLDHGGRAVYLISQTDLAKEVRPGSITVADTLTGLDGWDAASFTAGDVAELRAGLERLGAARPGGETLAVLDFPVRVVPVVAGRTLTCGGVFVDESMRVIAKDPSHSSPLWGGSLSAVGADVGGINSGFYLGGLSSALVTAVRASSTLVGSGQAS